MVDSASNRNEYQKYFLGGRSKGGWFVGLTTLPPSFVDCFEIWEPEPPGSRRVCAQIASHLCYHIFDNRLFSAFISSPASSVERFRFLFLMTNPQAFLGFKPCRLVSSYCKRFRFLFLTTNPQVFLGFKPCK